MGIGRECGVRRGEEVLSRWCCGCNEDNFLGRKGLRWS